MKSKSNGGSQSVLRHQNIASVINAIKEKWPITKKDIAERTGLSFAKVNTIILHLLDKGFIEECGKEESIGGRRSLLYNINSNYRYVIGCQFSRRFIKTLICNLRGEIVLCADVPYQESLERDEVINLLVAEIENIISRSGIKIEEILGVGIAAAALINPKDETVLSSPPLVEWGGISLKNIITERLGLNASVKNVANAAALAELNYGAGKGKDNVLFLNIGGGLGMGIIINGKLFEGVSGTAGEFGHIIIDKSGPLCECGNRGCLEAVASVKAVVEKGREMLAKGVYSSMADKAADDFAGLTFDDICEAANESDKLALSLITRMSESLGEGIVALINLFNPELIVLGGQIVKAGDIIINPLVSTVRKYALEVPRKDTDIVFSKLDENVGAVGASIPIIEDFFANAFTEE